jgi:hypothetical protein
MSWGLPSVDTADIAGWEGRIRGLVAGFAAFAESARRLGGNAQREMEQRRQDEHAAAKRSLDGGRGKLDRALREAVDAARATARQQAERLAPGLAGAPFTAGGWDAPGAGVAPRVRVGFVEPAGRAELPVVLPLLSELGWCVVAEPAAAAELVNNVLLRLLATAPAGMLRVDSFDPKLAGALGVFGSLREQAPDIVAPSATSPDELRVCLADLAGTVNRRAQKMAQLGCRTFAELLAAAPRLVEPHRIVVLHDYPAMLDERLHAELLRVVRSAAGRGVSFLVHQDPAQEAERDVDPAELAGQLRQLNLNSGRLRIGAFADVACRSDAAAPAKLFNDVCAAVGKAAQQAALPTVTMAEVLPPQRERWLPVGDELRVVVGLDDNNKPAVVRLRSRNPATPNMLVGGSVGTGKSNLLLVLIHGLAARYAPADLEMYLLDFKQGLEFADLGPGPDRDFWLPHAKVLGVYSDREFGLAVLRHVAAQMPVRGEIFKRHSVSDIADALPNGVRLPRIVLVLDEFQILLAEDDEIAEEATALLEKLVRLGRAFGIHLVLATQTLDGIQRLAAKRDAIFGQIHYRIALRTTASDSQLLLDTHNRAAAELRFRGQAVLNDGLGAPDANRGVLIAYADSESVTGLRRDLWRRHGDRTPPRIFQQEEPAPLAALLGSHGATLVPEEDGTVRAWVGQPVTVIEEPVCHEVRPEPGGGLLILGEDAEMALGVCTGLMASLAAAGGRRGDRFVVLDLLPGDADLRAGLAAAADLTERLGCPVEIVAAKEVPARLCELRAMLDTRTGDEPAVHVVGLGLHRAVRLNVPVGDSFLAPSDALRELAEQGAGVGVFLYGWWNRISLCGNHLGVFRAQIGGYLFLRHAIDGIREVCGHTVRWLPGPYRGLFWDGVAPDPMPLTTFAPLTAVDVEGIAKELSWASR